MKILKIVALTAALVVAAAMGAAVTPVAHGQTATPRARALPRPLDILSGRGVQIGVSIRELNAAEMKDGKGPASGVVVEDVSDGSPAATAGIKKGDVIVEFDGERVRSVSQFTRLVRETPSGRKAPVALWRDGQRVSVTVEPREGEGFRVFGSGPDLRVFENFDRDFVLPTPPAPPVPPVPPAAPAPPTIPGFETFVWRVGNSLGMTVSELTPQLAEYFGTKEGVLVTSVIENSAAAKAGVKAGDVVTSIDGSAVASPTELRRRVQRLDDGAEFSLGVVRDKKAVTLKGKIEEGRTRRTVRTIL